MGHSLVELLCGNGASLFGEDKLSSLMGIHCWRITDWEE